MTETGPFKEYIELYKKIFIFDEPPQGGYVLQILGPEGESKDYMHVDLSTIYVPSIYINVFDQEGIKTNGLNFGDSYSYISFKKHKTTGVISFYIRNIDNTLLPMEYADKKLYSIVNGKRIPIDAIIDELQSVLDQISTMPDPSL